jgi:hypothetical protein
MTVLRALKNSCLHLDLSTHRVIPPQLWYSNSARVSSLYRPVSPAALIYPVSFLNSLNFLRLSTRRLALPSHLSTNAQSDANHCMIVAAPVEKSNQSEILLVT